MNSELAVVDAVLANDEWDLFVFRLEYLVAVVDKFYIGESAFTFSGLQKELFFHDRVGELAKLGFDIEVVQITIPSSLVDRGERWDVETYSRNFLLENVCQRHPDDLVLFSDIDEIPSQAQVKGIIEKRNQLTTVSIPTQVFVRRANWIEYEPDQWRGKWGNALFGKNWVPRIRRGNYPLAEGEPGAHLSYVGMKPQDIRKKYQSFSHGELDRDELSSEDFIAFADHFHISHLGRALEPGSGLLRVVGPSNFTELQRAAFVRFPIWFDLNPVTERTHRRLIASWLLFSSIRGSLKGSLSDAYAPVTSWRWIRHVIAYAAVRLGWKVLNRLGMAQLLRSRSKSKP